VNRLVVLEARGEQPFVDGLRRAWNAGDAVFPLDPRLPAPAREALLAAARPDTPVETGDALVVATSGSTGEPRLAVLTHGSVEASARATSARLDVDPSSDRWLACLPLAHVGGLGVVTRALMTGTPLELHDRFVPAEVEHAAARCSLVSLVATALGRVDPSGFRIVLVGGSEAPVSLPPNAVATYGMTETGGGVVYDGRPLDDVELRVGPDGEIAIRAPMLLRAYRDGRDPRDRDGWFSTGDVGELRDGRLHVHGRRGDVITTGGEKVWPATVERVIRTHPRVDDVLVGGRPDPEWGQHVVAVVVPKDPAAPPQLDDLRAHVKAELPAWCAPRELELVHELPRTALGKVRRLRPG
jgi:O-succinylbenzoic acid--CoA ligase